MVGKFLILALVCVSLVQVQGTELENAIKRGLSRVKGLYENGQRRIDASIKEVEFKSNLIKMKTSEFTQKGARIQNQAEESVRRVADAMRSKAAESNKPNSVFECIDRVEENCVNQFDSLTKKLETDLQRLEKVKLANIETASAPLNGMQDALTTRYERAINTIKACTTPQSIDIAIKSCSRWLDALTAEMGRVKAQVGTVFTNFMRDANNYFSNTNRPINRLKSTAIRNIRQCLYSREAIFEEY